MYIQGNLVGALEFVAKQIHPSHHILHHGSPIPKKELTFSCPQPSPCQKQPPLSQPKGKLAAKKVQPVYISDAENPTHVNVPDDLGYAFDTIIDSYINAISTNNTSFDTSQPYAVCNKAGHTFKDCPVHQNVDFLRKHYIQFKLFLKSQPTSTATINHIQLTGDADSIHADPFLDEITPLEDFYQGWE